MSKITSYPAAHQPFPALFELEPVAGKRATVDLSAPELSSLGGLPLVCEYEKSSNRIIGRIESCINDPRREPMVVHSQTEMLRQRITAHWLDTAVASYKATSEEVRMFHSFMYKANSWKHLQRVVVKIEVNSLGTNVRYVVTDFKADRMSCNKFSANQFRLQHLTSS